MSFEFVLVFLVLIGFAVLFFGLKKVLTSQKESELEHIVDRVFGMTAVKVAEQSKAILQADTELIKNDLHHKHQALEGMLERVRLEMNEQQKKLQYAEVERSKEFAQLVTTLTQHKEMTAELKSSTETLARVLSNNQARGEWGERIIEDLLRSNGLVEGVHYLKQKQLGETTLRPDILLLLPNKKQVPIDVKFPYSEMQKLSLTDSKVQQKVHLKQFEIDLKNKIKKVADYIDVGNGTLDYAIMFVPNEAVFSFINQQLPEIVDMAVGKRVLLVSPFTFLIVARTILESYRHFMIADKLREVVVHIDDFVVEWEKLRGSFEKYGKTLDVLQRDYQAVVGARTRVMEKKVAAVKNYSGLQLEADVVVGTEKS